MTGSHNEMTKDTTAAKRDFGNNSSSSSSESDGGSSLFEPDIVIPSDLEDGCGGGTQKSHNKIFNREDSFCSSPDINHSSDETNSDMVNNTARFTKILRKDPTTRILKTLVLVVLAVAGGVVSTIVYSNAKNASSVEFETYFDHQRAHIMHAAAAEIESKLSAINSLAIAVQSQASSKGKTWPFVALSDFAYHATSSVNNARAIFVALYPLVSETIRDEYENYTISNYLEWTNQGLNFQVQNPDAVPFSDPHHTSHQHRMMNEMKNHLKDISNTIFLVSHDGHVHSETGTDQFPFYLPLWQHAPIPTTGFSWVNYNILNNVIDAKAIELMKESQNAVLGKHYILDAGSPENRFFHPVINSSTYLESHSTPKEGTMDHGGHHHGIRKLDEMGHAHYEANNEHHHNDALTPVSNLFYPLFDHFGADRELVAVLSFTIRWDSFFLASLPPDPYGIVCVVSNDCDESFTFEIDDKSVHYLGSGDLHDNDYDDYSNGFILISEAKTFTDVTLNQENCKFSITVYPSDNTRNAFEKSTPVIQAILVGSIFLFAALIFLAYDFLVERRQEFLEVSAMKSNAIVSSLFPEVVRDRLFEGNEAEQGLGMKKFIKETLSPSQQLSHTAPTNRAPIADLFSDVTVLFADIVGFTAWSSAREPSQVFTLLESIYGLFDNLAKREGVFKVETIGDCYVAVTGLPEPQSDHAVRMARFATSCLTKISKLMRRLELSLGPDTGDIAFRVGLHSGPVTAGVLRGEKSRFQLFGDTVNTAARMESLGKPNFIQASQTTADLLIAAGKSDWVKRRDERVKAKGKGEIRTFWVNADAGLDSSSTHSLAPSDDPLTLSKAQRQLRIEWSIEVLTTALKRIIAHRMDHDSESKTEFDAVGDHSSNPRDDLVESIPMRNKELKPVALDVVRIDPIVAKELEDFVKDIARKYHDNHFHNFDHACYVMMSARKFLNRIVVDNHYVGLTTDPLARFAVLFSALIHDMDHDGVSNTQLVHENHRLAHKYGNKSVAEQNSVQLAWEIFLRYKNLVCCICKDENEFSRFRQFLVNCVIATDIFDHDLVSFRNRRWDEAFEGAFNSDCENSSLSQTQEQSDLQCTVVLEHIIQASDVAHTCQHWHIYQKWNERLFQEMYAAYQTGRSINDPAADWYNGELWFFDNYVIPLAKKLKESRVFGVSSDECLSYAVENRREWEQKGVEIVEQMISRYHQKNKRKESSL